jgi:hypothetical protein
MVSRRKLRQGFEKIMEAGLQQVTSYSGELMNSKTSDLLKKHEEN